MDKMFHSGSVTLKHKGKDLIDEYMVNMESLTVEQEINKPAMFNAKFNLLDFKDGEWRGIDMKMFLPGDAVEIKMGMDVSQTVFKGEIVSIEPEFDRNPVLLLRGYDKMHRLRFGSKRRSFLKMKDSDIAAKVGKESGLSVKADATKSVYPYVFQNNVTDLNFLLERAKRIGFELLVDNDKLLFRKSVEGKAPAVSLEYGIDVDRFSPKMSLLTQGSEVDVRGWSVEKKEVISGKASDGAAASSMKGSKDGYKISKAVKSSETAFVSQYVLDAADAKEIAKGQYNLNLQNFITGEGEGPGNPKIRSGTTIEIKGLGAKFSGPYYIIYCRHSYDCQCGYRIKFKAKRTGI